MHNLVWQLDTGIAQCAILDGKDAGPGTNLQKFWAKQPLTSKNAQFSHGVWWWAGMHKSREEGEPSFPRLCNVTLVKAEPGPRLAQLIDGKLKESKSMKCMATLSDKKSDKKWMQNMNGRFNKQINMHVGEAIHRLGECLCKIVSCMWQQWDSNENCNRARIS